MEKNPGVFQRGGVALEMFLTEDLLFMNDSSFQRGDFQVPKCEFSRVYKTSTIPYFDSRFLKQMTCIFFKIRQFHTELQLFTVFFGL